MAEEISSTTRRGIYRGWPIAGVMFLSLGASIGAAQFAFGIFIIPLEKEFGWSRTQINVSFTLGMFAGLLSPFLGTLLDRYGARWLLALSLALIAVGFLLRAGMTSLSEFYFYSALVFAGTTGASMLPAGRLVSLWFAQTRGRTMGLVTAGNNFGGMVAVPVIATVIAVGGWRWGFATIGIGLMVVAILAWLIVRDSPEAVESEVRKRWAPGGDAAGAARAALTGFTTRQATRTTTFWLIALGMTLQQFARTAVATQVAPHLEQVGFSSGQAAAGLSLLAFFAMSSKIIFGRLSETITARYAYVIVIFIQVVGLVFIIVAGGGWFAWLALMTFGLGMGGIGALGPLTIVEMFGLKNYGAISGLTRPGVIIPTIAGPLMAGVLFDRNGNYDLAFTIVAGLLIAAMFCFVFARPPRRSAAQASA